MNYEPVALIPYIGKTVFLTLYDIGQGLCEVISANEDFVVVQWFQFCPCYVCQTYDKDLYTEPFKISQDLIAEIEELFFSPEEIAHIREENIHQDEYIFERVNEQKEQEREG